MRLSGAPARRLRNGSDHCTGSRNWRAAADRGAAADRNAGLRKRRDPAAVRPEPRPARAAERQHGHIRPVGDDRAVGPREGERAVLPSDEAVAHREGDAGVVEPAQPRAQQRRCLHRLGKHPAAGADEGRLAQRLAPVAQALRRKRRDRRAQRRVLRVVAAEKALQRFAVGEIEPAAAGEQEFPSDRRHAVVDGDAARPPRRAARPR